jgi:hypothetical protein
MCIIIIYLFVGFPLVMHPISSAIMKVGHSGCEMVQSQKGELVWCGVVWPRHVMVCVSLNIHGRSLWWCVMLF